jgi:hypothetical protein
VAGHVEAVAERVAGRAELAEVEVEQVHGLDLLLIPLGVRLAVGLATGRARCRAVRTPQELPAVCQQERLRTNLLD